LGKISKPKFLSRGAVRGPIRFYRFNMKKKIPKHFQMAYEAEMIGFTTQKEKFRKPYISYQERS
jgi:hypothetical protein